MALARRCAVCGGSLEGFGPRKKTCSDKCRTSYSRSRRSAALDHEARAAEKEIRDIVAREAPDMVTRVMKQELEPIVREAIDEDVLRAIKAMLGLTPRAVEVLKEHLESEDPVLQGRAATLVVKYTVGNQALKPEEKGAGKLNVIFNLPRPDDVPQSAELADSAELEPEDGTRVCDVCGEQKPEAEYVGGSDRCKACFHELRDSILARFAE